MSSNTSTPPTSLRTVADILHMQAAIERRLAAVERTLLLTADKLDALSHKISYLSTSPSEVRAGLQDIAAVLRRGVKRTQEVV